ncbi:DUF3604 domain-containing protein [Natrinema halophilum]|uniref:DUF3604 domain-containing protein n=1 Tax=Natrinema halophilum TaxID=1699371 RepID=UPI001F44A7E2|nr:DUF3604 domain-containing protein [Natrinema halophilum]UHQ96380.1 DUF3604 domain-containing protein [Natrinema halophilum]
MDEEAIRETYGTATITPQNDVVVGSFGTWTITYTAGELGLDDGARLKIAANVASDWGPPQFDDPTEDNYCSVTTSGDASVTAEYHSRGYSRPWTDTIDVDVHDGALSPGDTITLTLGDRSQGSMGLSAQSYPETGFQFIVLVDAFETEEYVRIADDLSFDLVPGTLDRLRAVVPSTASIDETVTLSVRGEDYWGNPITDDTTTVRFEGDDGIKLPETATLSDGVVHVQASFDQPGVYRVTVSDDESGAETTTNPVCCRDTDVGTRTYWGDIHGQSGETVGTGTITEYFDFAKEKAFLDFVSHAGNDFQITDAFWETIQDTVKEFHEPDEFVTFLCYEWSANTPNGGDHNVYFLDDEAEINRSSSWQVENGYERHQGINTAEELYETYSGRDDVLIIPHQGGRPATLDAFDPELTPFLELLSVWGVFEWFGQEALERGYQVGFVGGSDDHTGRPGASRPANVTGWSFPIKGGLMGIHADSLTRESLWNAFKNRRCYATTGARIDLNTSIDGHPMGSTVDVTGSPTINVEVRGTAPISEVDLFRGTDCVATETFRDGDDWLEVLWTGARSKTRHKVQNWTGGVSLDRGRIDDVEPFGFDHPKQGIESVTDTAVKWDAATAGNYQGVRLQLDAPTDAMLSISTPPVTESVALSSVEDSVVFDAGRIERRLELNRVGQSSTVDTKIAFEDDPDPDTYPYYVRVRQTDGEMAWSSPIFATIE